MNRLELQEPDAKVLYQGTSALSDAETLALILAGVNPLEKAKELLSSVDYEFNKIGKLDYTSLRENLKMSHLQAIRLIAVCEFARRKALYISEEKTQIKSSKDVRDVFAPHLCELDHEEFWVLYLSRSNRILKKEMLSKGGLSGTVTDVRVILRTALLNKASAIILAHNHPSGNFNPSESDDKITKKIKEASALMDIQTLDHVIITPDAFYSYADNGTI